jgi:hypothetical protein
MGRPSISLRRSWNHCGSLADSVVSVAALYGRMETYRHGAQHGGVRAARASRSVESGIEEAQKRVAVVICRRLGASSQ